MPDTVHTVSEEDRKRWDARYDAETDRGGDRPALPPLFRPYEELFPTSGNALDVACGRGEASVWLAARGSSVLGVDISPAAVLAARRLADSTGVSERCRFEVADLDRGLPSGPLCAVIVCHMFRDVRLDRSLVERLAEGGLLAIAVQSEVGARPGRFRSPAGELSRAFASLAVIDHGEGDGRAWLLGRK